MTQSFEDWIKQSGFKASEHSRRDAFEAGAASRQAEIDSLSTLNEMSEQKIDDLVLRNIELQKRIDKAMKYVSESPLKDVSRRAMLNFLDILKGESNE